MIKIGKNKKTFFLISLIITPVFLWFLFPQLIYYIDLYNCGQNSHRTNRHYLRWKKGKENFDPKVALQFIVVDRRFRLSLYGKTKAEIQKWFPNLRTPEQATEYQKYYNKYVEDIEFFWIGKSNWGLEFENGKLKQFRLLKG